MTLRCECARVQCALFIATVKVVRHIEEEFRCGKENGARMRAPDVYSNIVDIRHQLTI